METGIRDGKSASARRSQPSGTTATTEPTSTHAAAARTAKPSMVVPARGRNALGVSAPNRSPAPAASTIATAPLTYPAASPPRRYRPRAVGSRVGEVPAAVYPNHLAPA